MAIASELLELEENREKPLPINPGGWAGGGARGIIPYGSFDHETLKEAVAIIEGTSERYRFEEDGTLTRLELLPSETPEFKKLFEGLGTNYDISGNSRAVLHATIAILANAALKNQSGTALHEQINFTAYSHKAGERGHLLQGMFDDLEKEERSFHPQDEEEEDFDVEALGEEDFDYEEDEDDFSLEPSNPWDVPPHLTALLKEELTTTLEEDLEHMSDDLRAFKAGEKISMGYPYYDEYSGSKLLHYIVGAARTIRKEQHDPDAVWRLHNQFPEAVNFYMAAPEAEFLLNKDGTGKRIENIQHFANSAWMDLVCNLDLKVSPALLEKTRALLTLYPIRSQQLGA